MESHFPYDIVTTGPLNTISSNIFKKIKEAFCKISSSSVKSNWWTEFSSWEDFIALLRTGTRLSSHTVVDNLRIDLDCLNKVHANIETIDENGNIVFTVEEDYKDLIQF